MSLISFAKSRRIIPVICKLLAAGEVVAAPTETAYGLLADATNRRAVKKLLKLKGNRSTKPVAIIMSDVGRAKKWVRFTKAEKKLIRKFWPGPLTLVVASKRSLAPGIVSAKKTIGLRVPGNAWLRQLLSAYKRPLTATSANVSGAATPYSSAAVINSLRPRGLKYIVNNGQLVKRATSTVAQIKKDKIVVLRSGAISLKRLNQTLK